MSTLNFMLNTGCRKHQAFNIQQFGGKQIFLVRTVGFEPTQDTPRGPKPRASTNSATSANRLIKKL